MGNRRSIIVAIVCAVVVGIVIVKFGSSRVPSEPAASSDGMVRITPRRIPLAASVATLCIAPSSVYGPHLDAAEVHIYANQLALGYRRAHPNEFVYPIGAKFIKEKYSSPGDENPDVATVMERRSAKGDVSDWNFSIISLPARTPLQSNSQVSCIECHENYKDTGYVSSDSEAALRKHLRID
jgi:hypothetical protein